MSSESNELISGDPGTIEQNQLTELSHSDKMVGIFTEPKKTFEIISKFPLKTIDWFLPVLLLCLMISLTRILVFSNEEIFFQMKQDQIQKTQKIFDDMVAKGQMTREQAEQGIEDAKKRIDMGRGPVGYIIQTISILVIGFIFFFIVVLVYFIFARFILKGEGTYKSAMISDGLPAYISILQIVIASILSLAFGKLMNDTSVSSFMGMSKSTLAGFLLSKVDPFSIWVYSVISIGFAKMFKSQSLVKYFIMVFGIWIIGTLLLWLLGKAVPFLSFFTEM